MIRTKKRMVLCISLVVLNVAFIWVNSLLPSQISSAFSKLAGRIISFFFPGPDIPATGTGHDTLRKVAHLTEFCCLGILTTWLIGMLRQKKWEKLAYPLLIGVLVASADETIQRFVPGRGPKVRDVLIDSAGVLLGILILWGIYALRNRKVNK